MPQNTLRAVRRFWRGDGPAGDGSAVVEFAIAFPLQLFITFGLLQFILIAVATLSVNHAAHAAARAAVVGEDPARAAVVVLSPLAGLRDPGTRNAELADSRGLEIPGWGTLAHSRLAAEKVHVRLNDWPDPIPPRASPFTVADPDAYEDGLRYTDSALAARKDLALAYGTGANATVVVEFDYELAFPLVDSLYALFFRPRISGAASGDAVYGEVDNAYNPLLAEYAWTWEPGVGYRADARRVRMIGGGYHLVIARESTMYRGFGF